MKIPSGSKSKLDAGALALLYHELRPEASAYSYVLQCSRFEDHLRLLTRLPAEHYQPMVTFDDGHISNYSYALPMLERHHLKGHFFITAGWTGTQCNYMTPQHLRALHRGGHAIGAHGWSHTLLTQCDTAKLHHELNDTRAALEDHISAPVTGISLPGGRSNAVVIRACREAGYTTIWTSAPGIAPSAMEEIIGRFNIVASYDDEHLRRLFNPASGELERAAWRGCWKMAAQRALGDHIYARLWALLNHKEGDAKVVMPGSTL